MPRKVKVQKLALGGGRNHPIMPTSASSAFKQTDVMHLLDYLSLKEMATGANFPDALGVDDYGLQAQAQQVSCPLSAVLMPHFISTTITASILKTSYFSTGGL